MTPRSKARLLVLLWLCCWSTGCGVPLQDDPEDLALPAADDASSGLPKGALTATIYLADGTRLVPVERSTTDTSPRALLLLLVRGATAAEAEDGLRSALAPMSLDPVALAEGPRLRGATVEVAVTESFTGTTGGDQLLATAQLVWTLTEDTSAKRVRAVVNGEPIELPTGTGLSEEPVDRSDYRTVSPARS